MTLRAQLDHLLEAHHEAHRADLFVLRDSLDGDDKRITAPWDHLSAALSRHMEREESMLFPAVVAKLEGKDAPELAGIVDEMLADHDEIRTLTDALRAAARDAGDAEDELLRFCDHIDQHLEVEEQDFFPATLERLELPEQKPEELIRATEGCCQVCLERVPAKVTIRDDEVWLVKTCPEHGETTQKISGAPAYWKDLDDFYFTVNDTDYEQRDFIVRMTESCNLDCPICLAKANTEDTPDLDLSGLEKLLEERRGIKIDLMAAEPTLREDLEDWIRKVKASGNIAALHTNGLKLAKREYAQRIVDAGVDEVFLQFDGFDDAAHEVIRGRKLLKARMATMKNMRNLGVATSLITVIARGLNSDQVGEVFDFALKPENAHIREVFYLGLRFLGSARDATQRGDGPDFEAMEMMPDELIDLLEEQRPIIRREDVRRFNKIYFTLLSVFEVKKCLYVQHYLAVRDGEGGYQPISELIDLPALERASEDYARRHQRFPKLARAAFLAAMVRHSVNRQTGRMLLDFLRLQMLFNEGMNLKDVPNRFLLLGFITACDPHNFDSRVAVNCGKGELSVDGGFINSGAVANVRREARFDSSGRRAGSLKRP